MTRVSTTASFMPAWTRQRLDHLASWGRQVLLCWVCLWTCATGWAQETAEGAVAVQRSTDGLFITARLPLELGPAVEDALFKAVPVYFVYHAEVYEPRWYWTDKRIASATRTLRLAYQPLTRRWRLSAAAGAATNQQYALHQNFETLSEAVSALGRLARWRIADGTRLEDGERYSVSFRFRLDLSQLPRPFQIGMANQPDWNIDVSRQLRTTASAESSDGAAPAGVDVPAEHAR